MSIVETPPAKSVFLVDDDEGFRQSVAVAVQSRQIPVYTFSSAEEFLAGVVMNPVGCLIIDLKMPGMGGVELLKLVRSRDWNVPAIILSGTVSIPDAMQAVMTGVFDVIKKPASLDRLLTTIDAALALDISPTQHTAVHLRQTLAEFSELETSVLSLLLEGAPNKTVAARLDLGLRSVVRYRKQILDGFGIQTIPELAVALGNAGIDASTLRHATLQQSGSGTALIPIAARQATREKLIAVVESLSTLQTQLQNQTQIDTLSAAIRSLQETVDSPALSPSESTD